MIEFKDFSILSWNIRGAGNSEAKQQTHSLVSRFKPSLFAVMETHISFHKVRRTWMKMGYEPVAIEEAQGHSGGLWILSSTSGISYSVVDSCSQAITVEISKANRKWVLTAVYASPIPVLRENLWYHLCNLRHQIREPWLWIGDFNQILLPLEVSGGTFHVSRASAFADVMSQCHMIDLGLTGGRFTWQRPCIGGRIVSKRLDRAVACADWRISFQDSYVELLCRLYSDHNPILL